MLGSQRSIPDDRVLRGQSGLASEPGGLIRDITGTQASETTCFFFSLSAGPRVLSGP